MRDDDLTPADTPNARRSSSSIPKIAACPKCTTESTRTQDGGDCDLCFDASPGLGYSTRHVTISVCTAWVLAQGKALDSCPDTERNL